MSVLLARGKGLVIVGAVLASVPMWLPYTCKLQRVFLSQAARHLLDLKGRTALPLPSQYDHRVTLDAMLARGPDRDRWSNERAAMVDGYLISARDGAIEFSNCLSFTDRDTHVDLALEPDAPPAKRMIVEIPPRMRAWARANGMDWSTRALQKMAGTRVRVSGWLLFDEQHADEAENTRPGVDGNWRATAWELHPVTALAEIR